jgi:hypothetical protein
MNKTNIIWYAEKYSSINGTVHKKKIIHDKKMYFVSIFNLELLGCALI